MSTELDSQAKHWLVRYLHQYGKLPSTADQLCSFAQNNDGHISYRLAREAIALQKQSSAIDVSSPLPDEYRPFQAVAVCVSESEKSADEDVQVFEVGKKEADAKTSPITQSSEIKLALPSPAQDIALIGHPLANISSFGLNVDHAVQHDSHNTDMCLICMEQKECRLAGGQLCRDRGCKGSFCVDCLRQHVAQVVEAARFAVPFIRCPSCFGFLPSSCWRELVGPAVMDKWQTNGEHLLSIRCMECDSPGTLFDSDGDKSNMREDYSDVAFACIDEKTQHALADKWKLFERGELLADELLNELQSAWLKPAFASSANKHKQEATKKEEEVLEKEQVQEHMGINVEESDDGVMPILLADRLSATFSLIEDTGRRAVLQLAALRRFPKTETRCCQAKHCFRCKVGSHHKGVSCEEVQRRQMPDNSVQFCPACGVATLKTEGCNHMICLCGESWTWHGSEVWAEEWLSEQSS